MSQNANTISEGIRIYCEKQLEDRVLLSNGIEEVKEINGMPCFQRAFVPREPWRSPTAEEVKILQSSENDTDEYQQFGILTVPSKIKKSFQDLKLFACKTQQDAERIGATPAYKKAFADFVAHFSSMHKSDEPTIPHFIYVGKPGLRTNTFNRQENFFIGMHLDSWERKPMSERHIARNRICMNVGLEPRYLLFYNLEYRQIVRKAGFPENFIFEKSHHHYEALYKFYELFPNYPIIKLRIDPYEAYLAPTENVVHDGCTTGCTQTDVNVAVRGYYQIQKKQKSKSIFNFFKFN
jgi:hypothetical protein